MEYLLLGIGIELFITEDNQSAIAIAKNPVSHARTKHIDVKFHF